MAGDDTKSPQDRPGFDDLFSEIDEASSFEWDGDEVESEEEEETRPVVCFRVGDDLFAIEGDSVREIVGTTELTELPGSPPHVRGITVVRRQVVGLLSLRIFLGIDTGNAPNRAAGPNGEDKHSTARTVIVDTAHYTVGLDVDEVTGLDEWPESALNKETLPENIRDSTRHYARGARQQGDTLCVYLDLESLLDDAAVQ